jgi:hypothetical protein
MYCTSTSQIYIGILYCLQSNKLNIGWQKSCGPSKVALSAPNKSLRCKSSVASKDNASVDAAFDGLYANLRTDSSTADFEETRVFRIVNRGCILDDRVGHVAVSK